MPAFPRTFVGFGFGAIQAGLFLFEAHQSRAFQRLVVAEVVPDLVDAVRRAKGHYVVNVARKTRVDVCEVGPVEILNPTVPGDAALLANRLSEASEIATALPSVDFFSRGSVSVAALLAGACRAKLDDPSLPRAVVYTAENNNHAAEILLAACLKELSPESGNSLPIQFLNTVIGKMSGVIRGIDEVKSESLAPLVPDAAQAFLVEEFNRILISRISIPDFQRGITSFIEKDELLPFEEAKLYGHNAVHALLGYLAARNHLPTISHVADHPRLLELGRAAFLDESGQGLIAKYRGLDPLFTHSGYLAYADDLLTRMTNPWLRDRTDRVIRDPERKLGWDDRLIGTMRLALDAGVKPWRFALGAAAALATINPPATTSTLEKLWVADDSPPGRKAELLRLIAQAQSQLEQY